MLLWLPDNDGEHLQSLHIDTCYIKGRKDRNKLFNAIDTFPAVMKKAQWALQ